MIPLLAGTAPAGLRFCAPRPRASSPATASRWRPSSCTRSTCSSSSRSVPAVSTSRLRRLTGDRTFVTQQARNLCFKLDERSEPVRFLHERAAKFCGPFDEVVRTEGIRVIRTPVRSPKANAFAERFVRTVRLELLDLTLIRGRRHLDQVLRSEGIRVIRTPIRSPQAKACASDCSWFEVSGTKSSPSP